MTDDQEMMIPQVIRGSKADLESIQYIDIETSDTAEETYRLALESVFRWTLRRDELDDAQIVLAIKRVAKYALQEF